MKDVQDLPLIIDGLSRSLFGIAGNKPRIYNRQESFLTNDIITQRRRIVLKDMDLDVFIGSLE